MLIHVGEDRSGVPRLFGQAAAPPDARSAISEIEVLRSRRVIEPVVTRLGLDIEARPRYLPLVGAALARPRHALAEPGIFGHGGYCWGGEAIRVAGFDVPDALQDEQFIVTAGHGGRYRLTHPGAGVDAWGRVGATLALQSEQGPLRLHVDGLNALPGARFVLASSRG
jgi:tyrosine-protein kinase Etk/Wzc